MQGRVKLMCKRARVRMRGKSGVARLGQPDKDSGPLSVIGETATAFRVPEGNHGKMTISSLRIISTIDLPRPVSQPASQPCSVVASINDA
jgi:hypothetical protein